MENSNEMDWTQNPALTQAIESKTIPQTEAPKGDLMEEKVETIETETKVEKPVEQANSQGEQEQQVEGAKTAESKDDIFDVDDSEVFSQIITDPSKEKEVQENKTNPEVEKKIKFLEDLESDPIAKLVIEARLRGEDVYEALEKVKPINVEKLSIDDLKKEYFKEAEKTLKEIGLTEDEVSDEMEREMDKFNDMTRLEQAQKLGDIKQKMMAENAKRLEEAGNNPFKQAAAKLSEIRKQNIENAQAEWGQMKKDLVGKSMYGLELTQERIGMVEKFIQHPNYPPVLNSDGSINMQKTFLLYGPYALRNDVSKAIAAKAKGEGKDEVYREVTRPDDYTTRRPGSPALSGNTDRKTALANTIAEAFGGGLDKF
jgi:hypothetical protein